MFNTFLILAASYVNPVLYADFPNPDVCVSEEDGRAYLTAASFDRRPALPILSSDDLVNWSYVGHALPVDFDDVVLTPSIRYCSDKREFVIYWNDPENGVFRISALRPTGPWSEPRRVIDYDAEDVPEGGMTDPCPLYDDDGRIYLVNGWDASKSGLDSSVLTVRELNADETKGIGAPVLVYDGAADGLSDCTGVKFYRHNGEYWLFFSAKAEGAWRQVVARAKTPYGPYEARTVLSQEKPDGYGLRAGAWVSRLVSDEALTSVRQEDWLVGSRDQGAYGRTVALEPMVWPADAWPRVGKDGRPTASGVMPSSVSEKRVPQAQLPFGGLAVGDEFDGLRLGPQWHYANRTWQCAAWSSSYGFFRLNSTSVDRCASKGSSLGSGKVEQPWLAENLVVQRFPAERFEAVLKSAVVAKGDAQEAGLVVQGRNSARIGLKYNEKKAEFEVVYVESQMDKNRAWNRKTIVLGVFSARTVGQVHSAEVFFRLQVASGASCAFAWSTDGKDWKPAPAAFSAVSDDDGGATFGLYAISPPESEMRGWIDADWIRVR